MALTEHTLTLTTKLPGSDLPLNGTWSVAVHAQPPVLKDTAGHTVYAGVHKVPTTGGVATLSLPATDNPDLAPAGFKWRISFRSTDNAYGLGPFTFDLTEDSTLDDLVESTDIPVTPSALTQTLEARDEAVAAAAAATAVGTTTDEVMAGRIEDPESATHASLSATIEAGVVSGRAQAAPVLVIPTYDDDPRVGHPDVLHVPEGFGGYTYWMGFTPFPAAARENPSIVASNDGINWVVPTGLTNPIAPFSEATGLGYGWWSDTDLVLDGDTLVCYFRAAGTGMTDYIARKTSTDGVTWSATEHCFTAPENTVLSPAVVKEDDGTFTMFAVDVYTGPGRKVTKRTSADGVTWSDPVVATSPTLDTGHYLWHIDVTKVDGTYHAVMASVTDDANTLPHRLFYWTSEDGLTWTGSGSPAVPLTGGRIDKRGHYRSTLQPAASGKPAAFDLWTTQMDDTAQPGDHNSAIWRIGVIRDFTFTDPNSYAYALPVQAAEAAAGDEIWVFADRFLPASGVPVRYTKTAWQMWTMPADATSTLSVVMPPIPRHWNRMAVDACVMLPLASGTVRILSSRAYLTIGADIPADVTHGIQVPTINGAWIPRIIPLQLAHTPTHGKLLRLSFTRTPADAADTFAYDLVFVGLRLRRA